MSNKSTASRALSLADRGRRAACDERVAMLAYYLLLIVLAVSS